MNTIALFTTAAMKATVIFAAAYLVSLALRRASASARYLVWSCALAAALAVPPLSLSLRWSVPAAPAVAMLAPLPASDVTVAPPDSTPAARSRSGWAIAVWLSGVALVLGRLAMGHVRVLLALRRSREASGPEWARSLAEAGAPIGLRRRVTLRLSSETDIPLSYGLLRPVVLLPAEASGWSGERRRVVLMHEMVHARRWDPLAYLIAQFSTAAYWFHPLAWLALSRFRLEQERSCDDAVVRAGTERSVYAGHLVSLARSVNAAPEYWRAAVGMAAKCDLERRVEALLDPRRNRRALSAGVCALALTAIVACILPLAALRAQEPRTQGALSGSVLDPSGAAIPHAAITLKNSTGTNQEIARSGEDGTYRFDRLPAGTYEAEVRARGFALFRQGGVMVNPGAAEQLTFKLDLGQIAENIEVVGKGPRAAMTAAPTRIRVGGNVQATKLLHSVPPVYPVDAQSSGVEGAVLLRAVISKEGTPLNVSVLNASVDPALAKAALDAIQQWRYQPTLLNGVPVEVVTTVTVNFRLDR